MNTDFLAQEIRRYFTRRGNRYLFRNGLTLNQLAQHIAEHTGDFDVSIISRAIAEDDKKRRVLTDWQLNALADSLHMSPAERYQLHYMAAKDRCAQHGLAVELAATPPALTLAFDTLDRVAQARSLDCLPLAVDMLHNLYKWKRELDDELYAPPVLRLLSRLQLEQETVISKLKQSSYSLNGRMVSFPSSLPKLPESSEGWNGFRDALALAPAETLALSPSEEQIWQRYTQGIAVSAIAQEVGRPLAAVYAVVEGVKARLFGTDAPSLER